MPSHDDGIIIEFYRVGDYVKVSAIDPNTNTEASIVGDPSVGEARLKQLALQKLQYVLRKEAE
jgi:hypothetical protein